MTTLTFETPTKTLIVPIAAAGSGKSTLLNQVAASLGDPGFRFGNDDVRLAMCRGIFNQESSTAVADATRAMVGVRLASGLPAAIDCTHNGHSSREAAVALAARYGYRCVALLCRVPFAEVQRRNAARVKYLRVPASVVVQMHAQVKTLRVPDLLADGFDAVYTFDKTVSDLVIAFTG